MTSCVPVASGDYERAVFELMDGLGAAALLEGRDPILLKPNLVTGSPPPVTTDAGLVAAVAKWCRGVTRATILVVESSGEGDTHKHSRDLGYRRVPADELIDLDREEIAEYQDPGALRFERIRLPRIIMEGFLISIPALKDHSMACVTLSLKNLVGVLPASEYGGTWSFKKSGIHDGNLDQAIADLARYRRPDLALVDGRIGMKGGHLTGRACSPPKAVLVGGSNPWEVDVEAARILGWRWEQVGHLRAARSLFAEKRRPRA